MTHSDSSQDAILTRLAEMQARLDVQQATLDAQRAIITQQQAAISALQQERSGSPSLHAIPAEHYEATEEADDVETSEAPEQRKGLTSRRSLLRGAAAATAAASVGAVALGAAQTAHASPLTDGGNLIIGAFNTATMQTTIEDTGYNAACMLEVWNNAFTTSSVTSAIYGYGPNGASGVNGQSSTGNGVWGYSSTSGVGVYGMANTGWGVAGQSGAGYDFVANGTGIIGVNVQVSVGAPTSGYFFIGDCIRDANGDLWLCTAGDGTGVGTWVKVAHLAPGATSGGAITYISSPIRLLDTRPGQSAFSTPGAAYAGGSTHTLQVAGDTYNSVTVPASSVGAIGNVTVVGNSSGGGFISLVPQGAGFGGTAVMAFSPGQVVSNSFNVGLNTGALDIYIGGSASMHVDVIIDLFAVVA